MNNLESAEKKRRRLLEIIAIIIVLCIFLVLVFAANLGEGDGVTGDGTATTSVDTNVEEEENKIEAKGDKKIATVAPGGNFTVALDSEGNVWAWGQNNKGQLGNGTLNDSASKQPVLLEETDINGKHITLSNVKQVAAGLYHAVALTNNGEVYMWGYNYYGQAGSEIRRTELYPQKIAMPNGVKIKQVECSETYTLFLTTEGKVLGLGDSYYGQLGYYNGLRFTSIREIEDGKAEKELPIIEKISAGAYCVMALDANGKVWNWGDEASGTFELSTIRQVSFADLEAEEKIQEVEVGGRADETIALSTNGKVYTWMKDDDIASPIKPMDLGDVQVRTDKDKDNIAIINRTYFIISQDNKVYSWGLNPRGQAGIGNTNSPVATPTELSIAEGVKNKAIDKVSSSSVRGISETGGTLNFDTAYAINADGYVLGWGYAGTDIVDPNYTDGSNTFQLLGDGTRNYADYIGSISVKNIVGDDIVLDITSAGIKEGKNQKDVLDVLDKGGYVTGGRVNLYNSSVSENSKDSLTIKSIDETIAKYDDKTGNVIGVSEGRTLLEVASTKNTIYLNVEVIGNNVAFAKIETKDNFTVALKSDGTVWAWGYNVGLGIVDTEHSNYSGIVVPTQVKGLGKVKDIAVGIDSNSRAFVVLVKLDGTVWTWGNNIYGQLGDGTQDVKEYKSILTTEPELNQVKRYQVDIITGEDGEEEAVVGDYKLENIVSVSAGRYYTLAVDKNGKVWAWGHNGNRQLGLGNTNTNEPIAKEVDLSNLTNAGETIKQIEAGAYTSYILTNSGNVYAFGHNGQYQCGMSGNYYIPTKVTSLSGITKLSASMYSNGNIYALAVNGKVYAIGNGYGYPQTLGLENVVDISAIDSGYGAIVKFADGTSGYWTGNGSVNNSTVTKLKAEDGTDINNIRLIGGDTNNYGYYTIVKSDGTVWTAGTNSSYGRLGNRTIASVSLPNLKCISYPYATLNENEVTLSLGETLELNATYNYGFNLLKTEEEIEVTYTSLNEEVATVTGATITAVSSGSTYVTAKNEELGITLRVKVNVLNENETTMPNISVGYSHTVAVKTDGTVWGWGINNNGELGQTSTNPVKSPEQILVDAKIKDVAAGLYETLMVTTDGKVLAMGYNQYGIGDGTNTTSRVPVTVQQQIADEEGNQTNVDLSNIVKVTTWSNRNLALDSNGKLYSWGYGATRYAKEVNTFGLKVKDISERAILTEDGRVWEYDYSDRITFKDGLENIVQISSSNYLNNYSGNKFFMALNAEGEVFTWAYGSYNKPSDEVTTIPTKLEFEDEVRIIDIEAGASSAYVKDELGNVYSWGKNALGLGASKQTVAEPTKIELLPNEAEIEVMSASKYNGCNRAFMSNYIGTVYGFGYNSANSLLGNYDTTGYYYEPVQVGQSYLGFVDENGKEITRISLEKNTTASVETSYIDSFNIRNRSTNSEQSNCTWRVINSDLLSIPEGSGKGKTIQANNILGEATVIAEEIDSEGNKTGVYAKLYVDVVEVGTLVAPKMESVGNHTIALKADGTVWGWGVGVNYINTSALTEPTQIRIAKQVTAKTPVRKLNADGTPAVDENGREIYVYEENGVEKECYQVGDNYTDLSGKYVIRKDNLDDRLYAWDTAENKFALEDLVDENGDKIVVVDFATSNNHTLLLTNTGDVYSFGYNYYGQLGYGQRINGYYTYLPTKVTGLKDIVKIAVGDSFSLALDKYGRLWTFGNQYYYKNGYTYIASSTMPTQLSKLRNEDLSEKLKNAIDMTNEYILTKDGEVFTIGTYSKTVNSKEFMAKVPGITGNVIKVTRTSNSGYGHTAFLTDAGEVFTIGAGAYGQLGNDGYANSNDTAVQVLYGEENTKLTNIRDISVGENHTMAIDKNGKLYTWGYNRDGELRNSTVEAGVNTARAFEVEADEKIEDVILASGGSGFTVVADSTGYAFAWGNGTSGQLGNRLSITSYDAVRVGTEGANLSTNHVTLQENGESISIKGTTKLLNVIYEQSIDVEDAVSNDSNIASTSANTDTDVITISPVKMGVTSVTVKTRSEKGQIFENIIQVTVLPVVAEMSDDVKLPANRIIEPMTVSGENHTLILKSDGTVWAYGNNQYGQTGAKDANGRIIRYSDKETLVEFPEGTAPIIRIAAGDAFSVALDADGNVWTWGYNANGRLGLGNSDSRIHLTPEYVMSNIIKIDAGKSEVIALNKAGYVYTWGKNNGGSLGVIGTSEDQYKPIRIRNIAGAIDIAAGEYHSMVLTSDGTVWTTGRNTSGQLGRDVQKSEYFEKVELGEKIAYIEAGNRASLAIDVSGKVWVWGDNTNGQLGLGVNENKISIPTKVETISEKAASASIGENHIHVVTSSGMLYVAGSNNYGQLGVGKETEKTNRFVPVTALGNNVMNSNAGINYSTVIDKDGKVYGFGDYDLGTRSFTDSDKPVMITNTTLYLDEQEVAINVDGTYKINANAQYKLNVLHKDNSKLEYASANEEIAIVDETGVITGISVGTTTIYVTDEIEGKTSAVIVKVIPKDSVQAPSVEGGDKFTMITNANGESYVFGVKDNIAKTDIPSILSNSLSFSTIKAGKDFVIAINKDKTVWGLGDNTENQLGLEGIDAIDKMTILNTNNINNIVQIDAGESHVIALDELGIVYVWGNNSRGQLGIKATEQPRVSIPTIIKPVDDRVISVSAGGNYSAIVDTTGTAYIIQNGAARPITGIDGAIKVATGTDYTMVLTNDGIVYSVSNSTLIKNQVFGLSNIVDISVNNDTFMCLASDKTLYTFGSNENGKLGRNGTAGLAKKAAEDVFTMGAGYNNTYYINTQGEVLSAGLNTSGELGNGTSAKEDSTTKTSSNKYVKVGSQEFELTPKTIRLAKEWKVLVGGKDLKEIAKELEKTKTATIENLAEFNVFGNEIVDINDYDYTIANTEVAQISDASILEVTAKTIGTTVLTVTNKITKQTQELAIKVLTEDLLRIENMYINDTEKDFIAEPDANEDNKFVVNVEGSNPTGTLNIQLEFSDTIKVEDEAGNLLSAILDPETNTYKIAGLDLTKSVQELKITLTSVDGKTYEYKLLIFNALIVKVNDEMISAKDVLNKETLKTEKVYTKYVNPQDTEAKVEISIDNIDSKIQLETIDGTIINSTDFGEVLEIADLSLPNIDNRFIVKVLNASEKVEKQYVLRITKSSIEAVKVNDLGEVLTADRTIGTEDYLEEFSTKINDTNEVANITIELGNKDIATIEIDGIDKTADIKDSKLVISKELEKDESKTTDVTVKVTTNEGYVENYLIKISTISSNNNIEIIELNIINGFPVDPIKESRKVSDNILEIVLNDKDADLGGTVGIKPTLESRKAKISFNNGIEYSESRKNILLEGIKAVTDNQYEIPMIVKAENGDTKAYTLYIYKVSENTGVNEIKVTGTPSGFENSAEREEGTNNYVGKIIKSDETYKLSINLVDENSIVESVTINNETLEGLTKENGNYTIDISSDKIGETIEITVKSAYGNTENYTLTLEEVNDNAKFESVKVDTTLFTELETTDSLEAQVKAEEKGLLTVKAENENATVKVYSVDPRTDNTAKAIAEGKGIIEGLAIPFEGEKTKTLYLEITAEDGVNKNIKTLVATKLSNNTNVSSVTVNGESATKDNENTYSISVSEATTEATIVITAEDSNATVQINEASNKATLEHTMDISNVNAIRFTVTSEDGTNKDYTLVINKLSTDTSFTKEFQDAEGKVVVSDSEFVKNSEGVYVVEVFDTLGDIKLVVKPNNTNASVVIKDADGNVIENGIIPSNISQAVKAEITAEDGSTKEYTIVIVSKHHILEAADVTANRIVTELTAEDVEAKYKEVRVHPDSTTADIYVEADTAYNLSNVTAKVTYKDNAGNVLHDDLKDEDITKDITAPGSNIRGRTLSVDLVVNNETVNATVQITMTVSTGETENLTIDIVKGSTKANLDYVELVGKTTNDTETREYTNTVNTQNIIIDSKDNNFSLSAVAKENGTVKIYKLVEDTKDLDAIDLSTLEEIANKSEVTLTGEDQNFVIEVTSEFGANTKRYKLTARKLHTDAELKDVLVKVTKAEAEDLEMNLAKLGGFTYNEATKTYELTAWIPENIDTLSVSDLVADSNATVEWTNIGEIEYATYNTGDERSLAKPFLVGSIEKHINIRLTAENGDIKNYDITIKTIDSNMVMGDFEVYNITDSKDVEVQDRKAEILQAVKDIKVSANVTNGAVALKVLEVNGHIINETIETEFAIDTNELSINLNKDYTYVDESGNEQTIAKEAIRIIKVERQAKALGSYLYPSYYEEKIEKDTLTITRLMTDTSITMKYVNNGVEETITSADFNEAGELIIYLPSSQTELVINEIKADNEYVTVKHGQEEGNAIYSDAPYKCNIKEDKASSTETIKVLTEDGNEAVYTVKFVKLSANNSISEIKVNNYKAEKVENSDEYTHTILSSANRINIDVIGVEENATVKVYVSAINDEVVTVDASSKETTYSEPLNGLKVASKDIYSQLNKPLNEINKITVKVEVQAEDGEVSVKEYTLNIKVEASSLISINGINTDGVVSNKSQLVPTDFVNGGNPYSTDIIKVSADTETVELTDITYTDVEHAVLTDGKGNVLTNKSLTVNVEDNMVTEAKIVITLNENRQEFVIRIQKKSTDTSIKEVIADKDRTSSIDEISGSYELDVRSTVDPDVEIVLNNELAKVVDATVENLPNAEVSDIIDNKFTISNVAITEHQDIDKEEPIIIKVKVQAENEATEPMEYTIKLNRKHTETGLGQVQYEYDRNEETITNALDYTYADEQVVQTISANVEGIRISEILPVCSKATVFVQADGEGREKLDPTKLYAIEEGKERTFTITVKAEYRNEKTYTFTVRRLVANTKLDKIVVNGIDAIYNETEKMYTANIRVDETSGDIVVEPNDPNTIVKEVLEAKLLDSNTNIPEEIELEEGTSDNIVINNNKISIYKLLEYIDDATEDESGNANKYVVVKFVVQAEDPDVTEEYTLKITRQHIETGLEDISYNESTLTLNTETTERIVVDSTTDSLNINKITPKCNNATVEIKVDGKVVPQGESGFSIDLSEKVAGDGCIKQVDVTVTPESGNSATYKFEVVRTATNASITKIIANGKEATKLDETEEGIEAIYRVGLGRTTQNANIEAISSNVYANVEIQTGAHITNIVNGEGKATATYKMSEVAEDGTMEVLITVTPQDTNIEAKTYKLVIERMADRYILDQFKIQQVVGEGETADEPITISDNDEHTADFTIDSKRYSSIETKAIQKTYRYHSNRMANWVSL